MYFIRVSDNQEMGLSFGFPRWCRGEEPDCQCRRYRRCGFNLLGQEDPLEEDRQPTSVFLPGESHGQRTLVGYSPWGCKELDMTEHICTGLTFLTPESDEREMPCACSLILHLGGTCSNALPADLLVWDQHACQMLRMATWPGSLWACELTVEFG